MKGQDGIVYEKICVCETLTLDGRKLLSPALDCGTAARSRAVLCAETNGNGIDVGKI